MAFYPKGAAYVRTFKMISATDHLSLKTAASPAVNLFKNGGSVASAAGTVAELSSGWYKVSLTAADTNTAGDLSFYITGTGSDDTDFSDQIMDISTGVIGVNVALWNNKIATSDANNLPNVNVQDWKGATAASVGVSGVPAVDAKYWNSQAATADASGFPNVNVRDWNAQPVTSLPSGFLTTTFPSGTVASTTNITAATGVTLAAVPPVNVIQWLATQPLALSAQQVQAVIPATSVIASVSGAVGSVTGLTASNLDATISSRASQASLDIVDDFLDTEITAIKTKTDFLPSATAGAAGGLFIAGSNAATIVASWTTTGMTTLTGNVLFSDGLTIAAPSTANRSGLAITGNGTGHGLSLTSGNGATGDGLHCLSNATAGSGVYAQGSTANGFGAQLNGGTATGTGLQIDGVSGVGLEVASGGGLAGVWIRSDGNGIDVNPQTSGYGIVVQSAGAGKAAVILSAAASSGVADGLWCIAGGTGVPIRGDLTGNITGSVSGAVGSVTANVGGNVVGTVGSVTGSVGSISGTTFPANFSAIAVDVGGNIKIQANVKKNQALARFEFLITDNTNHAPATGAAATAPTRSIDGGAFAAGTLSAVTEVGNGIYYVDFGAGDLNGNVITLKVTSTNNDTVYVTLVTSP